MSKKRLKYDGIPDGDMTMVANVIGAEAARKLMHELPGIRIYIQRSKEYRQWYVRQYFDGGNQREIALDFGVSERVIEKDIVEIQRLRKQEREEEDRQGSLFGVL